MEALALYAWLWRLDGQKTLRDQQKGVARNTGQLNYLERVSLEVSRWVCVKLCRQMTNFEIDGRVS
ncbi:hypothetical protein ASD47_01685 [Caulobacter sp. Root1472]|nr:hypothetical protein ASD47_01685 [Caulobacter sp. Root1472]